MPQPTTRPGSRLLLGAVVACALLLGLGLGLGRAEVSAALADEEYVGVTSDLATFKLGIPKGGDTISYIEIGPPTNAFTLPCFSSGNLAPESLYFGRNGVTDAPTQQLTDPGTGELRTLRFSGHIVQEGIAVGELSISGNADSEGNSCAPRSFSWAAVARATATPPVAATTYRGSISAGQTWGGMLDGAGTVTLRTNDKGDAVTGYSLQPTAACSATELAARTTPLTAGKAAIVEHKDQLGGTAYARHLVELTGNTGVGAFYIDRDRVGCRPLAGIFVLRAETTPAVTPTPTAPPTVSVPVVTPAPTATSTPSVSAPSGTFASPPVFPPTGARLAQVVFRGGTLDQLGTALVGVNATGAWAQGSDGTYLLYVVGAPAFVNERFMRTFPTGFASSIALTVVAPQPTFGRAE